MSNQLVVETIDLTKAYDETTVVDRLNLCIEEGILFGFLGPNGAGKTTTILMLLGLTEPTSGVARVGGYNSTREPLEVKRISGYIPEKVGFYEDLTASYNLAYIAWLNGISEKMAKKRVDEALDTVGLSEAANRKVGEFSRGMKQRLAIADVLVKLPKVAILDEPTIGIDPEGVNQILDMIKNIARERKITVIISSHQLEHIQRICDNVGIMVKGKIVVQGTIDQIGREAFGRGQFRVEVQLAEINSNIANAIQRIDGVVEVKKSGDLLVIGCLEDLRPQIARVIIDNNGLLIQMKIQSYTLEDIYMKYFTKD
ncbi:ABC transporter ATP-binding protein [Candidatus Omnitrophota bacterium]